VQIEVKNDEKEDMRAHLNLCLIAAESVDDFSVGSSDAIYFGTSSSSGSKELNNIDIGVIKSGSSAKATAYVRCAGIIGERTLTVAVYLRRLTGHTSVDSTTSDSKGYYAMLNETTRINCVKPFDCTFELSRLPSDHDQIAVGKSIDIGPFEIISGSEESNSRTQENVVVVVLKNSSPCSIAVDKEDFVPFVGELLLSVAFNRFLRKTTRALLHADSFHRLRRPQIRLSVAACGPARLPNFATSSVQPRTSLPNPHRHWVPYI